MFWSLFSKFEKVTRAIKGYSYKRNGKRVHVKGHQRTVTQRKQSSKPAAQQATKRRQHAVMPPLPRLIPYNEMPPEQQRRLDRNHQRIKDQIKREMEQHERDRIKAIEPKPTHQETKPWPKLNDIIEVWTLNKWRLMYVDEVAHDYVYCKDYFNMQTGMYIWRKSEQAHLWRYADM